METLSPAQQEAVEQASRNIWLEIELRKTALERAVSHLYEGDAYEVTEVAEVFLQFLQVGAAIVRPTAFKEGAATNE